MWQPTDRQTHTPQQSTVNIDSQHHETETLDSARPGRVLRDSGYVDWAARDTDGPDKRDARHNSAQASHTRDTQDTRTQWSQPIADGSPRE
jgi:hypothetical protein